jgi:hypothetical protein
MLSKVTSWNALLRMLLVCTYSYLESVLRYKCLILDIYHPDTQYLRQQGCNEPWLSSAARRGREQILGKASLDY